MSRRPEEMEVAVTGYRVARRGGVWHTHAAFGPLLLMLAERVRRIHFHAALMPAVTEHECDTPLASDRIKVTPWPARASSMGDLAHPLRLLRQYRAMIHDGDAVFLRGGGPLLWAAHLMARRARKPVVHWLISNPVAVQGAAPSAQGAGARRLARLYARIDVAMTRMALRRSRAHVLANGEEVARLYGAARTRVIVSTSIRRADIRPREDTCAGPDLRLIFVGYVRPEKGIEHLLRAMPLLRARGDVKLSIVGSAEAHPVERQRLGRIAETLGVAGRVEWTGHVAFGAALFSHMDRADMLVLPSLSEGTPRVLVEARARGLPVVSTRVGGVPSSVEDGVDGLLVAPADPESLASAIQRILDDGALRRSLIRAGLKRVESLTLDAFIDVLVAILSRSDSEQP